MSNNLELRKYRVISFIMALQDEDLLAKFEAYLVQNPSDLLLSMLVKPMPKTITVEELVAQQNYKGIDMADFQALIKEINITEPIEELLATIK